MREGCSTCPILSMSLRDLQAAKKDDLKRWYKLDGSPTDIRPT